MAAIRLAGEEAAGGEVNSPLKYLLSSANGQGEGGARGDVKMGNLSNTPGRGIAFDPSRW